MRLGIYLDDSTDSRLLRRLLREARSISAVVSPAELGQAGLRDDEHFEFARRHGLVLLTKNPRDFERLHARQPDHPGILAVYQDNRLRDMSDADIAHAVQNLIDAGVPIACQFHPLNHWRY